MDSIFVHRNTGPAAPTAGLLQGIRVAIQSDISAAGWPTDAGSGALADFSALEDATVVQRLRHAGAFLCGSTRASEFGFGLQDSAAGEALRRKDADAELLLDIAGEGRLAAARAAVCGFKPSYGLVSRFGLVGLIPSMESCAVLSDRIGTIRDILRAVAGPDERDFSLPDEAPPDFSDGGIDPRKIPLGVPAETHGLLSDAQEALFRDAVGGLKKAGFPVWEVSLPDSALFLLVHRIAGSVEASSCAGRYDSVRYGRRSPGARNWNDMYLSSRGAAFGPLLKSYLLQGAFFQFERYGVYEDACRIRARLVADMQRLTGETDFLVLPATDAAAGAPASLADLYAGFALTAFANVTGQPVLYLPPAGDSAAGFQLTGPRRSDARLLALGEHLLNLRRGGNA